MVGLVQDRSTAVAIEVRQQRRSNRRYVSLTLGLIGAAAGAMLCSVRYLTVILLLEYLLVPPLPSPVTYGQFGFRLIETGTWGLVYGGTLSVLAYWRFRYCLLLSGVISLFLVSGEVASAFAPTEVTCAAMIIVGILLVMAAWVTSVVVRRFEAL